MFYCFVNPEYIKDNEISITGENFYHLKNVRRAKVGEKIKIRSDRYIYFATIQKIKKTEIIACINKKEKAEKIRKNKIILAPALIQEKNFDLILQFGTQLGVDEFYPMITQNVSQKNIKPNRQERWTKIILSASMQSQRFAPPTIFQPKEFEEILQIEALIPKIKILPYELEKEHKLSVITADKNKDYIIFIGPEGGWTKEEIMIAQKNNVMLVSLGNYILRTETASLTALTLLNSLLGQI